MRCKGTLIIVLALIFLFGSGCTVNIYKRAEYDSAAGIISESPVKIKSIILKNNKTIDIDRSVALVEVNKDFLRIRYFSGDTLTLQPSEIRFVVAAQVNKQATAVVNTILVIGDVIYVAAGVLSVCGLVYGMLWLFTLGQGF